MSLITLSPISNGDSLDATTVNQNFTTIANAVNGNLDDSNVKSAAAIQGSKIAGFDKVKLRLSGSPAVSAPSGGTTAIPWLTEEYKTVSALHSTSVNTSRITVQTTGYYTVSSGIQFSPPAAATGVPTLVLLLNGTGVHNTTPGTPVSTSNYTQYSFSFDIHLTAGDYIESAFSHFTGSTLVANVGTGDWFCAHLLP